MVVSDQLSSRGKRYSEAHRSKEVQPKKRDFTFLGNFLQIKKRNLEPPKMNNSPVLIVGASHIK